MPTHHVGTPSRRAAFADRASAENSSSTPAKAEGAAPRAERSRPQSTGKGSLAGKGASNSRFKQKTALAARTSPKTPVLRASKRAAAAAGARAPAEPAPARHAMLTPGAIRQQRQSANGSVLEASQLGDAGRAAREPSFDHGNTSSILSENSTVTLGSVDAQLSQSFSLGLSLDDEGGARFSLGSARNSTGSVRFSTGPGLGSFAVAAPAAGGSEEVALLENRITELQAENTALRMQCDSSKVPSCCACSPAPLALPSPFAVRARRLVVSRATFGHDRAAAAVCSPGLACCSVPCHSKLQTASSSSLSRRPLLPDTQASFDTCAPAHLPRHSKLQSANSPTTSA